MKVLFIACALLVCVAASPAGRRKENVDSFESFWPFASFFDSAEESEESNESPLFPAFPSFAVPSFRIPIPSFSWNFGPSPDSKVVNSTSKTEIINGHKVTTNDTTYEGKNGSVFKMHSVVITNLDTGESSSTETTTAEPKTTKNPSDNEVIEEVSDHDDHDDLEA